MVEVSTEYMANVKTSGKGKSKSKGEFKTATP